jgi:SAM-dependent methyltransferase
VGPFESWPGPAGSFDLVFAATAWHWIRPALRYAKVHALLRADGCLAFWSALQAFPTGFDPFFEEIKEVYEAIGAPWAGDWPPPTPENVPDECAEIEATGLFRVLGTRRYVWEVAYTAEEYIALLGTFTGHIEMEAPKREHLFREIRRRLGQRSDSRLRRHWRAILHVGRRVER